MLYKSSAEVENPAEYMLHLVLHMQTVLYRSRSASLSKASCIKRQLEFKVVCENLLTVLPRPPFAIISVLLDQARSPFSPGLKSPTTPSSGHL